MFNLNKFFLSGAVLSALALGGCGGGGDTALCGYDAFGDPIFCQVPPAPAPLPTPVASTLSFPLAQGLANIASQAYTFNVSAADGYGNVFSVAYSSSLGAASTFSGIPASTANVSQLLYQNGGLMNTFNATSYFVASPYQFLAAQGNFLGGSEVVNANTWQTPPVTATVGQSFPSFTATLYRDATNTVVDGTLTETIGLAADTATTALLCQSDTVTLNQQGINDGLTGGTTSNCFRIDANGNVLGLQINTQINGMQMLLY